mgnify:FL=1
MAESSIKPQKYIPNPFEAYTLKELKQPWRFYDSKEEFENKTAEFKKIKIETKIGEINKWQGARANALIALGAELFDYKEESLNAAENKIRENKTLWNKIQAAHLHNSAGLKPEIDLENCDLSAEDIFKKINESLDKLEKGKIVDGKYVPTKAEKNVLRTLGNYGEFIRNPKDEKEAAKFYEEIKKRFGRIAKRDDYQKFEPKQQKKQTRKNERKENKMSDDKEYKLSDEQLEFCKAHNIDPAGITSAEAYKDAVSKIGKDTHDLQNNDDVKTDENDNKNNDKDDNKNDKTEPEKPALKINEGTPQPEDKTNEETPDWVTEKAKWYKAQAEAGEIENYEQDTSKEGFAAKFNNAEIHYSSPDEVTVSQDAEYKVFDTMMKEPDNKGRPIEFPDNASKEVTTRLYAACVLNGNPMQGAVPTELDAETLSKCGLSEEQIKQVQDHLAASQNKNNDVEKTTEEKETKNNETPDLQIYDKAKADIQKISEIKKNFEQMKKDGLIAIQKDENGKPQIVAGEKGSDADVKNATAIMKEAAELVKAGLSENRGKDIAHDTVKLENKQQKDTNTALRAEQIAILKMQRGGR